MGAAPPDGPAELTTSEVTARCPRKRPSRKPAAGRLRCGGASLEACAPVRWAAWAAHARRRKELPRRSRAAATPRPCAGEAADEEGVHTHQLPRPRPRGRGPRPPSAALAGPGSRRRASSAWPWSSGRGMRRTPPAGVGDGDAAPLLAGRLRGHPGAGPRRGRESANESTHPRPSPTARSASVGRPRRRGTDPRRISRGGGPLRPRALHGTPGGALDGVPGVFARLATCGGSAHSRAGDPHGLRSRSRALGRS
jgi:hypothetical protein